MSAAEKAAALLDACRARGLKIAAAESCTGGMVAAALTGIPGASDVFECGFITYSDASKTGLLDVPANLIREKGAVSAEVAAAMATGALKRSKTDIAVAITGVAGPGGGSEEKPVGLVFIAVGCRGMDARCERFRFSGSRAEIRSAAVMAALDLLHAAL